MKIFIFCSFMLSILTAVGCSSNNTGQENNPENKSGSGLAMPQAIKLFASTKNGDLKAFIRIDNQEFKPMQIVDDRVQFDFSNLTPGNHQFEIEFKYSSVTYNETFTLASAIRVANLAAGNNDIIFAANDYKMDCDNCDNDTDGIVNIVELAGGTNPANSPNEPTFTNESSVKIPEKTNAVLLTLSATDPNEDKMNFSITSGEHQTLFDLNPDTNELRFKPSQETNRGTNNQYFVEVTATDWNGEGDEDDANKTRLSITITVVHFFVADNGTHGEELWISDGLEDGTLMVKDINPNGHSAPTYFSFLNGQVFFSAYDEEAGRELWKSDGTFKGTERVMDINPGSGDSGPTDLTVMDGFVYFSAFDGDDTELWKSDGTTTEMVYNINPSGHSFPNNLTVVEDELFFSADDGINGVELWKSDGNDDSTKLFHDIVPGIKGSYPSELTNARSVLFFRIRSATGDPILRKITSDRTTTVDVKDTNGKSISRPINLVDTTTVPGVPLFFSSDHELSADDGIGRELWRVTTSGQGGATIITAALVRNISASPNTSSHPTNLTTVSSNKIETLFFSADDGVNGRELWKNDDNSGVFRIAHNINTTPNVGSFPSQLTNVSGSLFFSANDGISGVELWRATRNIELNFEITRVKNIKLDGPDGGSFPRNMTNVNDALFFSANDGINGRELWHSDGINTYQVKDINQTTSAISDDRGLVALYEFNEGSGKLIKDQSGKGAGETLIINNEDAVTWGNDGGLSITGSPLIRSAGGAAKINQAIKSSNELSMELWIQPSVNQTELATILTMSNSHSSSTRNFTILQEATTLIFRLRTSETDINGRNAISLESPNDALDLSSLNTQHLVVTRNVEGDISVTLNGNKLELLGLPEPSLKTWPGDFGNWDTTFPLVIGGELSGGGQPWQGKIFRVAIYNCALRDDQITKNHIAGSEEKQHLFDDINCQ